MKSLQLKLHFDANSVLGLLQHVVVGDIADASKVHAATIFTIELQS
jgi:hypothetical protein